jgi:2-keto-4-pentenoate hydratase
MTAIRPPRKYRPGPNACARGSHRHPIAPLREEITDNDSAYAVQLVNVQYAQSQPPDRGSQDRADIPVQKQLGVDQPDFGTLFADMLYGDDEVVPLSRTLQPKVEAEVALVLAKDLERPDTTLVDVISATAYVPGHRDRGQPHCRLEHPFH